MTANQVATGVATDLTRADVQAVLARLDELDVWVEYEAALPRPVQITVKADLAGPKPRRWQLQVAAPGPKGEPIVHVIHAPADRPQCVMTLEELIVQIERTMAPPEAATP